MESEPRTESKSETCLVIVHQGERLVVRPPPGEEDAVLAQGDQHDLQVAQQVLAQLRNQPHLPLQAQTLKWRGHRGVKLSK